MRARKRRGAVQWTSLRGECFSTSKGTGSGEGWRKRWYGFYYCVIFKKIFEICHRQDHNQCRVCSNNAVVIVTVFIFLFHHHILISSSFTIILLFLLFFLLFLLLLHLLLLLPFTSLLNWLCLTCYPARDKHTNTRKTCRFSNWYEYPFKFMNSLNGVNNPNFSNTSNITETYRQCT